MSDLSSKEKENEKACYYIYICPDISEEEDSNPDRDWARSLELLLEDNRITHTCSGVIVACSSEEEADGILQLDLAQRLGPVNVTRLASTRSHNQKFVILSNVPLAIPLADLEGALRNQQIEFTHLDRTGTDIFIEIPHLNDYQLLLREGLDFYGAARFNARPDDLTRNENRSSFDNSSSIRNTKDGIIQCYRCQGFWHVAAKCPHAPRCVRCGDGHSVYACPRPRHEPFCCHCKGPHHAAYKECPVRLELLKATPINLKLSERNFTQNSSS